MYVCASVNLHICISAYLYKSVSNKFRVSLYICSLCSTGKRYICTIYWLHRHQHHCHHRGERNHGTFHRIRRIISIITFSPLLVAIGSRWCLHGYARTDPCCSNNVTTLYKVSPLPWDRVSSQTIQRRRYKPPARYIRDLLAQDRFQGSCCLVTYIVWYHKTRIRTAGPCFEKETRTRTVSYKRLLWPWRIEPGVAYFKTNKRPHFVTGAHRVFLYRIMRVMKNKAGHVQHVAGHNKLWGTFFPSTRILYVQHIILLKTPLKCRTTMVSGLRM